MNRYLKLGLWTLAVGVGPLMCFVVTDVIGVTHNSNPIGFGILAALTFWPAVILIVVGLVKSRT